MIVCLYAGKKFWKQYAWTGASVTTRTLARLRTSKGLLLLLLLLPRFVLRFSRPYEIPHYFLNMFLPVFVNFRINGVHVKNILYIWICSCMTHGEVQVTWTPVYKTKSSWITLQISQNPRKFRNFEVDFFFFFFFEWWRRCCR